MTLIELSVVAFPLLGILIGALIGSRHGFLAALLDGLIGGVGGFAFCAVFLLLLFALSTIAEAVERRRAARRPKGSPLLPVWPNPEASSVDPADIRAFRARLAETIAWCAARADAVEPKNSLRAPELTPENRSVDDLGYAFYDWSDARSAESVVASVSLRRSRLLEQHGLTPAGLGEHETPDGRLALMFTNLNFSDGLSATESERFYDGEELPPWDTWIWVLPDHVQRAPVVVSWVPQPFVALAAAGMAVNACGSIVWADGFVARFPFLQALQSAGLMRP